MTHINFMRPIVWLFKHGYTLIVSLIERCNPGTMRVGELLGARSAAAPPAARAGEHVVLVPGFANSPRIWKQWARRLREDGFIVHIHENPDLGRASLLDAGEALRATIAGIRERTGCSQLHVVGYSAGGLVGRVYVELLDGARHVFSLTTIATPHQGVGWLRPLVALARRAVEREMAAVTDLLPGSAVLTRLGAAERAADVRYTSVHASRFDGLVTPRSAQLPGAHHVELGHWLPFVVNHFSLLQVLPTAYARTRDALHDLVTLEPPQPDGALAPSPG